MNQLPEQIIVDILQNQMALNSEQVWIEDQNRLIPPDKRLYIIVGMSDSQVYSNVNTPVSTYDGMEEDIKVVYKANIQIDILSRDITALLRRFEVLTALNSVYSVQKQEENAFSIFRLPTSFVNSSAAEGGSNINRFSIIISCHAWYSKEKVLQSPNDYFNDFNTRVDDEETIDETTGLIEFEIKEE